MRVIMTGGGTGGHIYPAIAIADEIKRREPSSEILFVGTKRGMEKDIVPANGYPIEFITVQGFDRRNMLKNVETVKLLMKSIRDAGKIIKKFGPDAVIGTGGYVCGPVVRSAYKHGIKSYIHEQNAFPGLTNKLLSKHVDRVFMAFEEAEKNLKVKNPPITTGNPVRKAFSMTDKLESRKKLGIGENEFVILGFGGSLGAAKINEEMLSIAERFSGAENIRVIFATGKRYFDEIMNAGHPGSGNIEYMRYIDDMPLYLSACDIALTRSGALTVSEIAACGRASIMIPSPHVTNNHQFYNAKVAADRGASILIEEKDLVPGMTADLIESLSADRRRIEAMQEASAALGRTDAAEVICDNIGLRSAENVSE